MVYMHAFCLKEYFWNCKTDGHLLGIKFEHYPILLRPPLLQWKCGLIREVASLEGEWPYKRGGLSRGWLLQLWCCKGLFKYACLLTVVWKCRNVVWLTCLILSSVNIGTYSHNIQLWPSEEVEINNCQPIKVMWLNDPTENVHIDYCKLGLHFLKNIVSLISKWYVVI